MIHCNGSGVRPTDNGGPCSGCWACHPAPSPQPEMPEGVYLPCAPGLIHHMSLSELRALLATQGLRIVSELDCPWCLEDVPLSKAATESIAAELSLRDLHVIDAKHKAVLEAMASVAVSTLRNYATDQEPVFAESQWRSPAQAELARRKP
jgi:hypothetical protein